VSDYDPAFVNEIEAVAGIGNVIETNVLDVWAQDAWEIGFPSWPGDAGQVQAMSEAFETLRQGYALEEWGREHLLGPVPADPEKTGLSKRLLAAHEVHAYGGNLEVTPALPEHPLGRIVVGEQMPAVQKNFLEAQGMQQPLIELDASWLVVGHVDEFMAIIPGPGADEWQVVLASPDEAWNRMGWVELHEPFFYEPGYSVYAGQVVDATSNSLIDTTYDFTLGDPYEPDPWRYVRIYDGTGAGQVATIDISETTTNGIIVSGVWRFDDATELRNAIREGEDIQPQSTWFEIPDDSSRYILVSKCKWWRWQGEEFPALITTVEVGEDDEFWEQSNVDAANRINATRALLETELAGASVTFVEVPAIYLGSAAPGSGDAFAFVPGLVNLQIWSNQLWLPKPLGPRWGAHPDWEDTFEVGANAVLQVGSRTTHYIDDWNTYHRWEGEVHCGTNVIRVPPNEYRHWWLHAPN